MRLITLSLWMLVATAGVWSSSCLAPSSRLFAGDGTRGPGESEDAAVSYVETIKPLLRTRCFACHGALKQEGGLRLDTASLMQQGGDGGAAVVPGDAEASLLVERVTESDESVRMPAEGERLSADEIRLIIKWIDNGAAAPADESPQEDPRQHWAFQTPVRPALPHGGDSSRERNPIDALLAAKHTQHNLNPVRGATSQQLLRRVYLDLIGLPPTRRQLVEFLRNDSPGAFEQVVDRLLNSPQYGERWGRHWMDVWRYSDWYGKRPGTLRHSHPHIWRWRDWIIESLNDDKGYDRMVAEMIAGDELAPDDPQVVRATGFLVRNWNIHNRNVWLRETVEHTAKAFLAMTFDCARCHDHKFDPISQQEYHEFRALFEAHDVRIDRVPGQMDIEKDGMSRIYDAHPDQKTFLFVGGDDRKPDTSNPLEPRLPEVLSSDAFELRPVSLPFTAYYPSLRDFVTQQLIAEADRELKEAKGSSSRQEDPTSFAGQLALGKLELARAKLVSLRGRIAAERARLRNAVPARNGAIRNPLRNASSEETADLAQQASAAERRVAVAESAIELLRANQDLEALRRSADDDALAKKLAMAEKALVQARKKSEAARQAVQINSQKYSALGKSYPTNSTGRRLALVRWMVDRQNPLTARVAVNHIWLRHFGEPLVQSVDDFGLNGSKPSHPELLDWLAVELMDHDWSMKHIHRLIVTSSAWRMSSSEELADETTRRNDPENRFLWRMNRQRMQAEQVRDSVRFLAGDLSLQLGGPELPLDQQTRSRRRSLYFLHTRDDRLTMLRSFDAATVQQCYRRNRSITPHQALALVNGPAVLQSARLLAHGLSQGVPHDREFVQAAFEHILGRKPSPAEQQECLDFLISQSHVLAGADGLTAFTTGPMLRVKASSDSQERARENLVQVLFNHHDFVTIR